MKTEMIDIFKGRNLLACELGKYLEIIDALGYKVMFPEETRPYFVVSTSGISQTYNSLIANIRKDPCFNLKGTLLNPKRNLN